jgi:hypothetical protein
MYHLKVLVRADVWVNGLVLINTPSISKYLSRWLFLPTLTICLIQKLSQMCKKNMSSLKYLQ